MGGGIFCKPLVARVSSVFSKFFISRLVLAGKGPKIPRHWDTKRKCAFTLAEVLIVLAVLGVIAAMTIPTLIQDAREKALITALKKNYTIFSQAVDMAIADNGTPENWDLGEYSTSVGALKLYNILKPYLRIQKECGTDVSKGTECFADHYEALFNTNFAWQPATWSVFARGVLASGASFLTYSGGAGCPYSYCGQIFIDVNGKAGPNKAGVDLFMFYIKEVGLIISGSCRYNDTDKSNGINCAGWAIKHENMDYLRKAGNYNTKH